MERDKEYITQILQICYILQKHLKNENNNGKSIISNKIRQQTLKGIKMNNLIFYRREKRNLIKQSMHKELCYLCALVNTSLYK